VHDFDGQPASPRGGVGLCQPACLVE